MTQHDPSTNGTVPAPIEKRRMGVKELEKLLPSPEEVALQAQELRAASVACINVSDVNEMMAAVLKKAKEGDTKSVKLILDHLNSHKPEPPKPKEPIRVGVQAPMAQPAEPEPAKPVAIAGPGADQHRRLLAYVLLAHQPMSVAGLGQQCGLSGEQIDAVLNHEWFQRQNGQVRLTPAGRSAVG